MIIVKQLDEDLYLEMLSMPRGTKDLQLEFASKYLANYKPIRDSHGNFYVVVEDGEKPDVAFMCDLDTYHHESCTFVPIAASNGFATLDQDEAEKEGVNYLSAGCTNSIWVMMNMIENNVPGLYCFFLDGSLGACWAADHLDWAQFNSAISFDAEGTTAMVNHQLYAETSSDALSVDLIERLGDSGLEYFKGYGDGYMASEPFIGHMPNCASLSSGFYNRQTKDEQQDLNFLIELIDVCCMMDWSELGYDNDDSIN